MLVNKLFNLRKFEADNGDGGGGGEPGTALSDPSFDFKTKLSPEYRTHPGLKDINSIDGLAKGYISAQSMVGQQRLPLPPPDASPEVMGTFYDSLGRPQGDKENGFGYKFTEPTEMPKGVTKEGYEPMEKFFREKMHGAGLSQKQADAMYGAQMEWAGQTAQGSEEGQATLEAEWKQTLRKDWGLAHDEQEDVAKQAIEALGTQELKDYFNTTRLGNHPEMMKFAAKVGSMMIESGKMGMNGRPDNTQMTPDQARVEIQQLQQNVDFMKRYNNQGQGHKEAVEQMSKLHNAAHPESAE